MEAYKREFIEFMVESDVLKFGDFTLKSGRKSPFFMNAGAYVTGEQLHRLGLYYAQAINDNFGLDFDVVFGPAYKGIPLAVVTAMALQELMGRGMILMNSYNSTAQIFAIFGIMALLYFVVCFTLSQIVRAYQRRLREARAG